MNKKIKGYVAIALLVVLSPLVAVASDDDHEEVSSTVGPQKGITEANHELGFKLSAEAVKNFQLKMIPVKSTPLAIPLTAIYTGLQETNIYRMRLGFIKRIDFKTLSSSVNGLLVQSVDLSDGDAVIVEGIGYLRIAELSAFGGVVDHH